MAFVLVTPYETVKKKVVKTINYWFFPSKEYVTYEEKLAKVYPQIINTDLITRIFATKNNYICLQFANKDEDGSILIDAEEFFKKIQPQIHVHYLDKWPD